jgi:putative drug exporter of the RND superfamily
VYRDVLASLAIGILMDAFFVRTLLVPSTVVLLGRWNWWPSSYGRRAEDAAPVVAEKPEFMPYGTPPRR